MKKKVLILTLSMVTLFSLIFSMVVLAEDFVDPEIPSSWYEAPQLASELGISDFNESPMLKARVESGELPPVEERLPKDPPVIEPVKNIGEYGGTATVWGTGLDFWSNYRYLGPSAEPAGRVVPDATKIVPYLLKSWDFSEDATELTLNLREGLKWSDGKPFTSDEYLFWWEHVAHNKELTPIPPEEVEPIATLDVTAPDKNTVVFKYSDPNPRRADFEFQNAMNTTFRLLAAHDAKKIHPSFAEEEEIQKIVEESGLNDWVDYFNRMYDSPEHPEWQHTRASLLPYIATERTDSTLVLERNPYYPFVDTEGNQLPYIDRILVNLLNDRSMGPLKMITGEATIEARYANSWDLPLYKQNEEKEGYKTKIFSKAYGSDVAIHLNLSHKDPAMRELFLEDKFRKALSLAIDRKTISEKMYFGLAKPMQASVPPTSEYYSEEYAQSYAEFDIEKANSLLDEIGMLDINDDGFREMPNGDQFRPTFTFCEAFTDPTPVFELTKNTWAEIGIDVQLKKIDRELQQSQMESNDFDISWWVVDNVTDVGLGNMAHISKIFAPGNSIYEFNPWPGYINWYQTKGDTGIEPPDNIKHVRELSEIVNGNPDESKRKEAMRELVKLQAENLWVIGTVALPPQPVLVNDKLKNVPETGIWDWSMRYMTSYYPIQFYLEE